MYLVGSIRPASALEANPARDVAAVPPDDRGRRALEALELHGVTGGDPHVGDEDDWLAQTLVRLKKGAG